MKLLINRAVNDLLNTVGESEILSNVGILVTPPSGYSIDSLMAIMAKGSCWAGDNNAYTGFNREAFIKMLKRYQHLPNCLFVAAPDVVANAEKTLLRFRLWQPVLRHYGYPVALVAQDGLETLPIPWDDFDVLFIGGTTEWKLGHSAALLTKEAKQRGKLVHMGRVNSRRRINYASSIGCDTCDGTGYSKFLKAMFPKSKYALRSFTYRLEGF